MNSHFPHKRIHISDFLHSLPPSSFLLPPYTSTKLQPAGQPGLACGSQIRSCSKKKKLPATARFGRRRQGQVVGGFVWLPAPPPPHSTTSSPSSPAIASTSSPSPTTTTSSTTLASAASSRIVAPSSKPPRTPRSSSTSSLLPSPPSFLARIIYACEQLHGTYSFIFLSDDMLITVRDDHSFRPLARSSRGMGKSHPRRMDLVGNAKSGFPTA